MFQPPPDLFTLIDRYIARKPYRLCVDHWHTLPDGSEANTPYQILHPECRHDVAGWVVALTPGAAHSGLDADVLANHILDKGLYNRIPWGILYGTLEDQEKLIKRRADFERSLS